MDDFVLKAVQSFCFGFVANVIMLVVISSMGTGFGFGHFKKDMVRVGFVALVVALADGAWTLVPQSHWSWINHCVSGVVHVGVLRMTFLEEITHVESVGVAAGCRSAYWLFLLALANS